MNLDLVDIMFNAHIIVKFFFDNNLTVSHKYASHLYCNVFEHENLSKIYINLNRNELESETIYYVNVTKYT